MLTTRLNIAAASQTSSNLVVITSVETVGLPISAASGASITAYTILTTKIFTSKGNVAEGTSSVATVPAVLNLTGPSTITQAPVSSHAVTPTAPAGSIATCTWIGHCLG